MVVVFKNVSASIMNEFPVNRAIYLFIYFIFFLGTRKDYEICTCGDYAYSAHVIKKSEAFYFNAELHFGIP